MNEQGEWPAHGRETREWRQHGRRGARDDRMLRQIEVSLPPMIAALDYRPAPAVSLLVEEAARAVIALDAESRGVIQALGGLLLRTESVASSRIERVDASIDAYARAAAGIKSDESATSMVAATMALASFVVLVTGSKTRSEDLRAACSRVPFGARALAIVVDLTVENPTLRRIGDADVVTVAALDQLPIALQKVLA